MNRAKSEPMAARKTPSPTLAIGAEDTPVPGNSPAAPCSSQGFEVSLCVESHHTAITASPEKNRIVTPMAVPSSGRIGFGPPVLGQEVLLGAGDVVVVGPPIDDGEFLAPVPMRRRSFGGLPFERGRPPGIAARFPSVP